MPVCPLRAQVGLRRLCTLAPRLSPVGSGRSREALHPRPWPGLMTVTVTRLWGSCWAPMWPCAGDLQPCSLTRGHGCLFSPGRGPLRPWVCSVRGGPARGSDTDWAQAWCRAARGASCVSAVQPGRCPRKWACVPVCVPAWSAAVRPGGGAGPTGGVHLSLPPGRGSQHALMGPGQV